MSGGMPRSGSTLLFNILRLCLKEVARGGLAAGWIEDLLSLPPGKIYLVKTHQFDKFLLWRAKHVFYSYRDVRDALVSGQRKFSIVPSVSLCREYINEYLLARKYADLMLKFEYFTANTEESVAEVVRVLGVNVDVSLIVSQLPSVGVATGKVDGYDKETLLHNGHSTGTQSGSWRENLPVVLQRQINDEFAWWFEENGYDLS